MRRNLVPPHARKRQPRIFTRQSLNALARGKADVKFKNLPGAVECYAAPHWPGISTDFLGPFYSKLAYRPDTTLNG